MLSKRIIPCLDVDAGRVVKGVSFVELRDAGDPGELGKFYNDQGADELVFLDITASSDERNTMIDVVATVSETVFIPLTVGGGIRSVANIRSLLNAGADKVSINSAAINNPGIVSDAAKTFGNQCIVVAIDAKQIVTPPQLNPNNPDYALSPNSQWQVYSHGGRRPTGIDALKWAQHVAELGAGEILLTSMDRDGHKDGYDLDLTQTISQNVQIPVIASGGAGHPQHFKEAFVNGKADAALAASIFHYGEVTIKETKQYLAKNGIPVRM
jgi:cyclase